jgi:Tfp pilus assembly protein PilX
MNRPHITAMGPGPRRQQGVVLFVALIVLVVMMLAGLALMRQMSGGTSIAGNVAFKENTTSVADRGIEAGIQWVLANKFALSTDAAAQGYYSSWSTNADPASYTWDTAYGVAEVVAEAGNDTRFIIHRLCQQPNTSADAAGQYCSDSLLSTVAGTTKEVCGYNPCSSIPVPGPFYQITARVMGPRNSVSYVQVLIN